MRISFDKGNFGGRILLVQFGRGAGYIGLFSYTFWIGWKVYQYGQRHGCWGHWDKRFSCGITRNANKVPLIRH